MSAAGIKPFEAIAIVGLGLIGGSVAKAVRSLGLARQILGYDNNEEYHKEIKSRELADYLSYAPDKTLAQAELVLLAVSSLDSGFPAAQTMLDEKNMTTNIATMISKCLT